MGRPVTLKEAADSLKVNVKTLRRAISRGDLPVTTVDTPRPGTYIVDLDTVHRLFDQAGQGKRRPGPRPNPLDGVEEEVRALRQAVEEQTRVIQDQAAKTASIEAELHETKAALVHAMEQLQKALPAPPAPVKRGFRWPWAKD